MEDMDRCNELQDFLDTICDLRGRIKSKDLKDEIDYLIGKYNPEYEELDNKLMEEAEEDKEYLNQEYWRDAL